jgi:DUF1365 family protein
LLKLITRECTTLWEVIDFHPHDWCPNDRTRSQIRSLTDDILAALLTRVNAQDITKYVSSRLFRGAVNPLLVVPELLLWQGQLVYVHVEVRELWGHLL